MPLLNRRGFLNLLSGVVAAPSISRDLESPFPSAAAVARSPLVERRDENGGRIVECSTRAHDGGALTISLSELAKPHGYQPGAVYFNLYQQGPAWRSQQDLGVCLTPTEIDELIINLVALRERARAVGVLSRRFAGGGLR